MRVPITRTVREEIAGGTLDLAISGESGNFQFETTVRYRAGEGDADGGDYATLQASSRGTFEAEALAKALRRAAFELERLL